MRYLVRARVKPHRKGELLRAINNETLGQGSVAEGEYLRNMGEARVCDDRTVRWVEVCYCPTPLQEERPYWEQYFDLTKVQDAHDRRKCRDENGSEPWACGDCDCTSRLEQKLKASGAPFLDLLSADSLSTDSLNADSLSADSLSADSLSADSLSADSLRAGDDSSHQVSSRNDSPTLRRTAP